MNVSDYEAPSWSDYPVTLSAAENTWIAGSTGSSAIKCGVGLYYPVSRDADLSITATVNPDKPAVFVYDVYPDRQITVFVDDVKEREIQPASCPDLYKRYQEKLSAGSHTIRFEFGDYQENSYGRYYIHNIACMSSELVEVSLKEPGSLGTEVLYNVDKIQEAKRLKVHGEMNSQDWATIKMMDYLQELDLSDATSPNSGVPDETFKFKSFLEKVVLPEGITSIGEEAFYTGSNYPESPSSLKEVAIPSSVTSVGDDAFRGCSFLKSLDLSNVSDLGSAFYWCTSLNEIKLCEGLETLKQYTFSCCYSLEDIELPESLVYIQRDAFSRTGLKHISIPSNVTSIGYAAFYECDSLKYVEIPQSICSLGDLILYGCDNVERIRLNAPTKVSLVAPYYELFYLDEKECLSKITLEVPSFLVNYYKLDSYWYNCKEIKGFDITSVAKWTINQPLILGSHERLLGTPSIEITQTGSLKVTGEDAMPLNDVMLWENMDEEKFAMFYNTYEGITIAGALVINQYVSSTSRWYYLSLPFNVKVGDIAPIDMTAKCAVRYYDGASRAENGATGNWKNYTVNDIIPAGTGFIFRSSKQGWWSFPAQNDASKQLIANYQEAETTLAENPSSVASNRGWNLIGNPYQSYYNIHKLNFTAPITVRNLKNNNYEAYSIIDDDYALRPNQAFFVQCPNAQYNTVTFPLAGRQMNAEITSQNAANTRGTIAGDRKIINLTIGNEQYSDRTRVVLNEGASVDYEIGCDASKFLSDDAAAIQIYSVGGDVLYAINERPEADGTVSLGIKVGTSGNYTIASSSSVSGSVLLLDKLTNQTIDLSLGNYTFSSEVGTFDNRFLLIVNGTSGINEICAETENPSEAIYNLNGIRVNAAIKGVYVVGGKKIITK